jgi:hypothetical protein
MIPVSTRPVTLASASERRVNVSAVGDLPIATLVGWEPWEALRCLARGGADLNVYQPAHSAEWRIWLRPICPAWDGRMTPDEWTRVYRLVTSYPTDSDAVIALSAHYATLLREGNVYPLVFAGWRRPDGLTLTEQALSLLMWRFILAAGDAPAAGQAHFMALVATGERRQLPA